MLNVLKHTRSEKLVLSESSTAFPITISNFRTAAKKYFSMSWGSRVGVLSILHVAIGYWYISSKIRFAPFRFVNFEAQKSQGVPNHYILLVLCCCRYFKESCCRCNVSCRKWPCHVLFKSSFKLKKFSLSIFYESTPLKKKLYISANNASFFFFFFFVMWKT